MPTPRTPHRRARGALDARVALLAAALMPRPACAQDCAGCGAREAPARLGPRARIAPPGEPGAPLVLEGVVYEADGRTPAPGVVVYAYHTNALGAYPGRGDARGMARWHGALRGWARTDAAGRYRFDTVRPGAYPGRSDPAHVHLEVRTPAGRTGWIDAVVDAADPRVTPAYRAHAPGRGGGGVVPFARDAAGAWHARRDVVLGRAGAPSDPPAAVPNGQRAAPRPAPDTLRVDPARSVVRWTGTKFRGLGRHAGTVAVAGGWLVGDAGGAGGELAGLVAVDLRTIAATDVPAHEPVPRARLERHLRDSAFFWVDRYPTATLHLRAARPFDPPLDTSGAAGAGARRWRVAGDLALRGRTAPVAFDVAAAPLPGGGLRAAGRLVIDRQRWGVAYRGSRLTNDLVDDAITLDLVLVAR